MTESPRIVAVVAMNELRVIGRGGTLPWRNSEDMAHFKAVTTGNIVVMGRKTWESLPPKFRPLPGRLNIVVTRAPESIDRSGSVAVYDSPQAALCEARNIARAGQSICVIGGAEIYRQTLPLCDEVYLTVIPERGEGDAWLPEFEADFELVSEEQGSTCRFLTYRRR